jgi:hypothetical protein
MGRTVYVMRTKRIIITYAAGSRRGRKFTAKQNAKNKRSASDDHRANSVIGPAARSFGLVDPFQI